MSELGRSQLARGYYEEGVANAGEAALPLGSSFRHRQFVNSNALGPQNLNPHPGGYHVELRDLRADQQYQNPVTQFKLNDDNEAGPQIPEALLSTKIPDRTLVALTFVVSVVGTALEGAAFSMAKPYSSSDFDWSNFWNEVQATLMALLSLVVTTYSLLRSPRRQITSKWIYISAIASFVARLLSTALFYSTGPKGSNAAACISNIFAAMITMQLAEVLSKPDVIRQRAVE